MRSATARQDRRSLGETLFLDSRETLQYVLLPFLPTTALFRLACTSKRMLHWLINSPPHLWQVCLTPSCSQTVKAVSQSRPPSQVLICSQEQPGREVAAGYLGSLPSTEAVFTAFRAAHKAKLAIHSGAVPTGHAMVLYGSPAQRMPGAVCYSICCEKLTLSSCGKWLAVTAVGEVLVESSDEDDAGLAEVGLEQCYGLVVYNMSDMCTEVHRRWAAEPLLFGWAASKPHLSIACLHSSASGQHSDFQQTTACVFDCQTETMLHALTPQTEEALHPVRQQCQHAAWCSTGRRLLTFSGIHWQDEDNQGMLAVIDVWESSLLVQSPLTVQRPILNTLLAAWHPVALVLSYGIILHRPHAVCDWHSPLQCWGQQHEMHTCVRAHLFQLPLGAMQLSAGVQLLTITGVGPVS